VFFVGGTNVAAQIFDPTPAAWGHKWAWVFMNDAGNYHWLRMDNPMSCERWYPTATRLVDGTILVEGHEQYPVYPVPTGETRDLATITYTQGVPSATWESASPNVAVNHRTDGCSPTPGTFAINEYPRQHALSTGKVFWTGLHPSGASPYHRFLDFLACSGPIPTRWNEGLIGSVAPQNAARGSVHFIDFSGLAPHEVVYDIGGGLHESQLPDISAEVVRMVDPSETTLWEQAPAMNLNAVDANCVILLDGSIGRFGGYGVEGASPTYTYPARLAVDMYQPPEVFTSPANGWKLKSAQQHQRRYHSTAVLLPDGRVLSAGGNNVGDGSDSTPEPSWWSVEVFSPPYLFKGPRPRLVSFPGASILMGNSIDLSVVLRTDSNGGEFRVTLIAPGAATHAFDQSQMYVRLKTDPVTPNPVTTSPTSIRAYAPLANTLPPGWYMLSVVNSVGAPSIAKWIKVESP